jgi:putative nucleotidyltransferase with HDIG domain
MGRLFSEERRYRDAIKHLNEARSLFKELQAHRDYHEAESQLEKVMSTYLRVARQWSVEAIDTKDGHAAGRSERVANYADALGSAAGLSTEELNWLRVGALLHDVGKTVIPAEIVGKTGALSAQEWEILTRHTIFGDEIVCELGLPDEVRPVVRNHHERWDGLGYPDRLAGDRIPFQVRIVTVADVFDALIHPRNYRRAYSQPEARRILDEEAGRTLDPMLVSLFLDEVLPFMSQPEL